MTRWDTLLDEARAAALAGERARQRWLGQQAAESATLVGALLDLAESDLGITVRTRGGRRHDGFITALGIDVVVLDEHGAATVVPLAAIEVVRPLPGARVGIATGDRAAAVDLSFVEVAALIAPERPAVAVALAHGETLAGTLVSVGADVLSVRVAPGGDGIAYVSTSAVSSLRFG